MYFRIIILPRLKLFGSHISEKKSKEHLFLLSHSSASFLLLYNNSNKLYVY